MLPSLSILKPVCDELSADMDVNLPQLSITCIHEFVRQICGDHDDLPGVRLQCGRAYREGRSAFLDDEDLLVGMPMQPNMAPGRHVHPDKRDLRTLILGTFEFVSVPIER